MIPCVRPQPLSAGSLQDLGTITGSMVVDTDSIAKVFFSAARSLDPGPYSPYPNLKIYDAQTLDY